MSKRHYPLGSKISADALIIFLKSSTIAKKCRKELLKIGISTKILPEAYTWHFASEWKHIPSIKNLKNGFPKSKNYLERCVSIPIFIKMSKNHFKNIGIAVKKATS